MNKDRSSLGYNSKNVKRFSPKAMEGCALPLSEIFASARHLIDGQICVLEEERVNVAMKEGLVYKKVEGQELTN